MHVVLESVDLCCLKQWSSAGGWKVCFEGSNTDKSQSCVTKQALWDLCEIIWKNLAKLAICVQFASSTKIDASEIILKGIVCPEIKIVFIYTLSSSSIQVSLLN